MHVRFSPTAAPPPPVPPPAPPGPRLAVSDGAGGGGMAFLVGAGAVGGTFSDSPLLCLSLAAAEAAKPLTPF